MKLIIATVIALCLAVGQSQPLQVSEPWNSQLMSIVEEMSQIGENAGKALVHQYEEIVLEPQHQLEEAVEHVEARRDESPECVSAEDAEIDSIVNLAHEELHVCGLNAAHDSAEIVTDVNEATQQLVFGGYALGKTQQKCKSYKNAVLKSSCNAKLMVQATVYLVNARISLKTIAESTNKRIPGVFTDSNVCTHVASAKAVDALEVVNANIDTCIAQSRRRLRRH